MKTERFWPGTGAASPSIPTVAGAPMAMVPVGVRSSAKTGTGRAAGHLCPEGREALDVVGDDAD